MSLNWASVKAWLQGQTAVDWIAHLSAIALVAGFLGFQAWAMHKGQTFEPRAFGMGAASLVGAIVALLYVKHKVMKS